MIRALVVMLIAAIGLSCALAVDRMRIKLNHANSVIEARDQTIRDREAELTAERAWSDSRESVIKAMLVINTDIEEIRTTIRDQGRISRKAFEELLKNDKAIRDYLALPVPEPLGLLYERPTTTDPTRYGPSGKVPAEGVRDAGEKAPNVKP